MAGKKTKGSKQAKSESGSAQFTMRVVESSVCEVCKRQCARGIRNLAYMSIPGAIGQGVPCILTRKRV
jgi:hypothetical protein